MLRKVWCIFIGDELLIHCQNNVLWFPLGKLTLSTKCITTSGYCTWSGCCLQFLKFCSYCYYVCYSKLFYGRNFFILPHHWQLRKGKSKMLVLSYLLCLGLSLTIIYYSQLSVIGNVSSILKIGELKLSQNLIFNLNSLLLDSKKLHFLCHDEISDNQ